MSQFGYGKLTWTGQFPFCESIILTACRIGRQDKNSKADLLLVSLSDLSQSLWTIQSGLLKDKYLGIVLYLVKWSWVSLSLWAGWTARSSWTSRSWVCGYNRDRQTCPNCSLATWSWVWLRYSARIWYLACGKRLAKRTYFLKWIFICLDVELMFCFMY